MAASSPSAAVPALAVALALLFAPAATSEPRQSGHTVQLILDFLELVRAHRAGTHDEAVREVGLLPWAKLQPALDEIRKHGRPLVILHSAALLTDVSFHIPVDERPQLRTAAATILAEDGEPRGHSRLDSHLAAARRLLDALPPARTAPDHAEWLAHVHVWYRAVSAVLMSSINLADLESHVERGLQRFPDDAGILFDAGSYFETYASPLMQNVVAPRSDLPSQRRPEQMAKQRKLSPGVLLADAERYFREAADRDPEHAEARVRLGRLLTRRGRAAEAIPILETAVRTSTSDTVQYFALLHLGQALVASGKHGEAVPHFLTASALFPNAQAAQLGLSHALAESADAQTTREPVARVLARRESDEVDPWAFYYRGRGRDYESIYAAFASRMRALPPVPSDWRVPR